MKMRTLLFGVILGLLAVVHSTPLNTVTQIPAKAEDEVFREAATDGFLVDNTNVTAQTSQRPTSDSKESDAIEGSGSEAGGKSTTSVSLQPGTTTVSPALSSANTASPRDTDGSSSDSSTTQSPQSSSTSVPNEAQPSVTLDHIPAYNTTDPAVSTTVSPALSSTNTASPRNTDGSSSDSSTTQSPQSSSTSVPNEAQPSVTPDHSSASQTTDPAVSTSDSLSTLSSDSGSGFGSIDAYFTTTTTSSSMTSSANAETSTTSSTSTTALIRQKVPVFAGSEGSGSGSGSGSGLGSGEKLTTLADMEIPATKGKVPRMIAFNDELQNQEKVKDNKPAPSKAGGTPGWMIIVGFIVGLAALVVLFVAIATRDKWNGPSRASQVEDKSNTSNQKREVEMETFLHKDHPKENGHATEYTVIPLDELSENHSAH